MVTLWRVRVPLDFGVHLLAVGSHQACMLCLRVRVCHSFRPVCEHPRQYYDSHVAMMGEHSIPLMDGGWVNSFLQSAEVYGMHLGKHYYHKVPWTTAGYDFNFSVYEMPDDRPVRIGVLADWSTGTPAAHHILKLFSEQKPDVVVHLGDTYYSGTPREQMDFMVNPMRAQFPPQGNSSASTSVPFYAIPGNHDYFSGGCCDAQRWGSKCVTSHRHAEAHPHCSMTLDSARVVCNQCSRSNTNKFHHVAREAPPWKANHAEGFCLVGTAETLTQSP